MNGTIKLFGNILLLYLLGQWIYATIKGKRQIRYEECAQDRQEWVKKHEKS